MHYYKGPLPTPNTPEHWLFYRPYGKCVYQAIFEPGFWMPPV